MEFENSDQKLILIWQIWVKKQLWELAPLEQGLQCFYFTTNAFSDLLVQQTRKKQLFVGGFKFWAF